MTTVARTDAEFPAADGTVLRGWCSAPDATAGPRPGVVMAHGFSAVKEMGLERTADRRVAGPAPPGATR